MTLSRMEGTTYIIQCTYITGSDAIGCIYTLLSTVEGVKRDSGFIKRTDSIGELMEISHICWYNELMAHDWERDNTTGTLPIKGIINYDTVCSDGKHTTSILHHVLQRLC